MQSTFRLGDFILWSLHAGNPWLPLGGPWNTMTFLESIQGPRCDVSFLAWKTYCTATPIIRIESSNETCQKSNAFAFFSLRWPRALSSEALARVLHFSRLHEQITCISCNHGVVFHIWQKEVDLIGNVTSSDRMSTKTLSFPNRYFSDKLCISANCVCSVVLFKAFKHFFVARLFCITLF